MKKLISENTLETYIANRKISFQNVKQDSYTKTTEIKQDRKSPERPKHTRPERFDSRKDIKATEHDSIYSRRTPERLSDNTRQRSELTERRESSYSYTERRTSSDVKTSTVTRRSQTPEKPTPKTTLTSTDVRTSTVTRRSQTPEKSTPKTSSDRTNTVTRRSHTPEKSTPKSTSTSSDVRTSTVTRRSQTPEKSSQKTLTRTPSETKSSRTETKETYTQFKKTVPLSVKTSAVDDKPDWVKQRNLRKTSETAAPVGKKTVTSKVTSTTKTETVRRSPAKETKPTDLITSSYGVGPTDENGTPLFGLRALRAQNKVSKGKLSFLILFLGHLLVFDLL